MREKFGAREPMVTADQAREEIRNPLDLLVRHHVDRGAPRMRAYARVGAQIGRTPAWVQRVLGRRPDAAIGLHDALNIQAAYTRLCDRIAAGTDAIEAANDKIRRDLDAALGGDRAAHSGASRTSAPQAAPARSPRRATASALVSSTAQADLFDSVPGSAVNPHGS